MVLGLHANQIQTILVNEVDNKTRWPLAIHPVIRANTRDISKFGIIGVYLNTGWKSDVWTVLN